MKAVGVPRALLAQIPHLGVFLGNWGEPVPLLQKAGPDIEIIAVAGWGCNRARSSLEAQSKAQQLGVPYLALADRILTSIPTGHLPASPWAMTLDDMGNYEDAAEGSRFLSLLQDRASATEDTARLIERFHQLGTDTSSVERPLVIVIDQHTDDPALQNIDKVNDRFRLMLDTAVTENPDADVIVPSMPYPFSGILQRVKGLHPVPVDSEKTGLFSLLRVASRVYTVSSAVGIDALLLGKRVSCFGPAFYAGYGLTEDRGYAGLRAPIPYSTFIHAFFGRYARYYDPVFQQASDAVTISERLIATHHKEQETRSPAFVYGVSRWKQPFVSPFIGETANRPRYVKASQNLVHQCATVNGRLMVWAAKEPEWLGKTAVAAGLKLYRIEDGFIRSLGLGSNFTPALSLVFDDLGIYFDPGKESRLEHILNTEEPSPALLDAARKLRAQIVEGRISKYNMEVPADRNLPVKDGASVILIPGQVEDDASIRLGALAIKTNLGLIEAVRAAAPDAMILYKPHPDVESGNRPGRVAEHQALQHADAVIAGWDAPSALDVADEVHTMTSLLGFEALMRGKHVVTYGLPFYAGLGLTEDRLCWPRLRRPVDLDTLVAATYLLYPRYRDPSTNLPVTAFDVLRLIERMRQAGVRPNTREGRFGRWTKLVLSRRSG